MNEFRSFKAVSWHPNQLQKSLFSWQRRHFRCLPGWTSPKRLQSYKLFS